MIRFVFGADTKDFDNKVASAKKQMEQLGKETRKGAETIAKWGAAAAAAGVVASIALVSTAMRAVEAQRNLVSETSQFNRQSAIAAKNAALFGQNLSDIDTKNIVNANEGVRDVMRAFDGVVKQISAKLAPVIEYATSKVTEMIKSMGGVGAIAEKAFGYIVESAAFVADAVDGIKRVFELAGDAIIIAWNTVAITIAERIKWALELANKIPGVDLSGPLASVEEFSRNAQSVVKLAASNMGETLGREMAGDKLKKFFAEAEEHAKTTAQRITQSEVDEINKRLIAMQEAGKTRLQKAQDQYAQEIATLKLARANGLATEEEANQLSIEAARRYNDVRLAIDQEQMDKQLALEKQKEEARRAILGQAFSGLTTLMNSGSRKLFEVGKAAAIGQALISTYTGITKALELGWPMGPIAASAIATTGFANVASIRKQSFGGGGGGGTGATGSVTGDVNAATQPTIQRNISVNIAGESVSKNQVREFIGAIGDELGDNVQMGMLA